MPPKKRAAAKKIAAKKAPAKKAAAKKATAPAESGSSRSDEILERLVRQAEHAGQTVLIERRDYSEAEMAELKKALDRRVEVNLSTTGGRPIQSMAAADPEVQRLEAPFRRKPRLATEK